MNLTKIKKTIGIAVFSFLFPLVVKAQGLTPPPKPGGLPGGSNSTLSNELRYTIELFLGIVGLIAVGFLIYGGFRYITSGGNDETAEGAKKTIQNAIIGLIVIILSYVIVTVIINALANDAF